MQNHSKENGIAMALTFKKIIKSICYWTTNQAWIIFNMITIRRIYYNNNLFIIHTYMFETNLFKP